MNIIRLLILIAIVGGAFYIFSLYSSKNKDKDHDDDIDMHDFS